RSAIDEGNRDTDITYLIQPRCAVVTRLSIRIRRVFINAIVSAEVVRGNLVSQHHKSIAEERRPGVNLDPVGSRIRGVKIVFNSYGGVCTDVRILLPAHVKRWVGVNDHLSKRLATDKGALERAGPFGVRFVTVRTVLLSG